MTRKSTDLLLESLAVVLSILYTWLYLRGLYPLCYLPAFIGSILFAWLCYRKKIYAETFLHIFYVAMAVYGAIGISGYQPLEINLSTHFILLLLGGVGTGLTAFYLKKKTDSKLPILDAFTTVYSLIATALMVSYVHENWLYWIVIDGVAIFLYAFRRMYIGAVLYLLYLFMAIDGFFKLNWF